MGKVDRGRLWTAGRVCDLRGDLSQTLQRIRRQLKADLIHQSSLSSVTGADAIVIDSQDLTGSDPEPAMGGEAGSTGSDREAVERISGTGPGPITRTSRSRAMVPHANQRRRPEVGSGDWNGD